METEALKKKKKTGFCFVCFGVGGTCSWDLSFLTKDQTRIPGSESTHWATRESPKTGLKIIKCYFSCGLC